MISRCGATHRAIQARPQRLVCRAAAVQRIAVPMRMPYARRSAVVALASATATPLSALPATPVMANGELSRFPDSPGVYAVYDASNNCQYVGLSRKLSVSITTHMQQLPELVSAVKFLVVDSGSREELTASWKVWIEELVNTTGSIPDGNMPGETKWQSRQARPKSEIKLTAGKGITGITIEQLIDQVVKDNKVVAFVKGTRTQPACGFSFKLMTMLNDIKVDYEVVNVLDDLHNPGLRDAIKVYSQWPTIPQLYIKGEFVGGADIVEQMMGSGELATMLRSE